MSATELGCELVSPCGTHKRWDSQSRLTPKSFSYSISLTDAVACHLNVSSAPATNSSASHSRTPPSRSALWISARVPDVNMDLFARVSKASFRVSRSGMRSKRRLWRRAISGAPACEAKADSQRAKDAERVQQQCRV
mgnify:CR=1 FL=1